MAMNEHNKSSRKPNFDTLYERALVQLEERIPSHRFLHSVSVADMAAEMATMYNANLDEARIAGLLHDWDKDCAATDLIERACAGGFEFSEACEESDVVSVLHAFTGARALKHAFPELPDSVIQAIARHTMAASTMSDLDMIVYIADKIEPLRESADLAELRAAVGKTSLEELFMRAYEIAFRRLIAKHRFIHPDTLVVWNEYASRERMNKRQQKGEL